MNSLKGWIISNGYLKTPKFMEIIDLYRTAGKALAIELEVLFNNDFLFGIAENSLFFQETLVHEFPDFVLFLDKDIRLAYQLEQMGIRLFNSSKVIALCDDKSQTFQALAGKGIKMPKTIIAPLVFKGCEEKGEAYTDSIASALGFPLVVKECYGSFGEQVYLVHNQEELRQKRSQLLSTPHIYQEFIKSSKGKDVRLNVVGWEVVAAMFRESQTDFRANVTNGGTMSPFDPPESFVKLALKVCELIGADFAGVDLLFGEDEEPVLCEVNSNAHIKNIQTCTGVNVAEYILKHIAKELNR